MFMLQNKVYKQYISAPVGKRYRTDEKQLKIPLDVYNLSIPYTEH